MTIGEIIAVISFAFTIIGEIIAMYRIVKKIANGTKCQMRTEMLNIYFRHCEEEHPTIKQYEYENFEKLYLAYTSLNGNGFCKKIWDEIQNEWSVER